MKLSRQPRQLWKNCTQIWEIFHEAFAFKDPCKLTFTDYEPYFTAVGESNIVNKVRHITTCIISTSKSA